MIIKILIQQDFFKKHLKKMKIKRYFLKITAKTIIF